MSTLNDEDLTRLLDEVASSYDVPEHGPDEILAALADVPPVVPLVRRRWVQLSAAAAVITAGAVLAATQLGGSDAVSTKMTTADKADAQQRLDSPTADRALGGDVAGGTTGGGSYSQFGAESGGTANASGGTALRAAPGIAAPVPPAALPDTAKTALRPVTSTAAAVGGVGAPEAPTTAAVGAPVADEGDSRVVKSGSIALVVKDKRVTPTLTAVINAAKSYGGYVSASNGDEYGETPSGEVTVRVPVGHFEDLVNQVRGLDAKVRTSSTSGKDVTAAYSDLESQLRTLRATRERFQLILSRTKTISEILTVQQRVDNVSGQIDKIEGQRKLLADQSQLSTLAVSVSEEGDPVVKATTKPRSGISQAFENAKDGFVSGVESIISHSGRAVLWLVCLAALAVFLRSGFRVARRRMV
ncbi:MAG: hypothetical protein QOE05_3672 [Actinomycetota bacterium]|nr:hypothetical protein [Actinomycetota bacterium]